MRICHLVKKSPRRNPWVVINYGSLNAGNYGNIIAKIYGKVLAVYSVICKYYETCKEDNSAM